MSDLRWVIVNEPQPNIVVFAGGIMMLLQQRIVSQYVGEDDRWETIPVTMEP